MSARTLIASASVLAVVGMASTGAMAVPRAAIAAGCGVLQTGASPVARAAVQAACEQVGVWYSWGGGHAGTPGASFGHYDGHDPDSRNDGQRKGFDCSGLVRYAYYRATGSDILNGPAHSQFQTSHAVARFAPNRGTGPLLPGDLLFYGSGGNIHHVAIYIGKGQMVEAYESGTRIRVTGARTGGDYAGAVRINGAGAPAPAPGPGKHMVSTFADAVGYRGPSTADAQGVLNKGSNYVYCRVRGARVGSGSQFNHWWLRTDLDRTYPGKNGRGAYVSAYYLARWGNDQAKDVNGADIPDC